MSKTTFYSFPLLLSLLLVTLPGCFDSGVISMGANYDEEERVEFECEPPVLPSTLEVRSGAGAISIEGWDKKTVKILAIERGATLSDLEHITPVVTCSDDGFSVRTQYDKRFVKAFINYKLKIPREMILNKVKTASGSIKINGVTGNITAESGAGRIDVLGAHGKTKVQTGSGSVVVKQAAGAHGLVKAGTGSGTIKIKNAHGKINAATGSGSISIDCADSARGDIDVDTGSGRIDILNAVDNVTADTGSGTVVVKHRGLKPETKVDLKSSSGRVELMIPSTSSAYLSIKTKRGNFGSAFPIKPIGENITHEEMTAKIGGSDPEGAHVFLQSSIGNIRILKY